MGRQASSTISKIYIHTHEQTALSTVLCSPKLLEKFVDAISVILKRTHLENRNSNLHQNIKFTLEEECIGELALLDNFLNLNNEKISALVSV